MVREKVEEGRAALVGLRLASLTPATAGDCSCTAITGRIEWKGVRDRGSEYWLGLLLGSVGRMAARSDDMRLNKRSKRKKLTKWTLYNKFIKYRDI